MREIHLLRPKKNNQKHVAQKKSNIHYSIDKENLENTIPMKNRSPKNKAGISGDKNRSKSRKDHSIQRKSPLKIPKKQDQVTFRKNNNCQNEIDDKKQTQGKKSSSRQVPLPEQVCLLEDLWKISKRLKSLKVSEEKVNKIQDLVKQIIVQLTETSPDFRFHEKKAEEKIELKPILCERESKTDQNMKEESCDDIQLNSSKGYISTEKKEKNFSFSGGFESTQELQLKKIMYMLDDKNKQKNGKIHQFSNKSNKSSKSLSIFFESLSSFNQYSPTEESGFTIEEIQKQEKNQIVSENLEQCTGFDEEKEIQVTSKRQNHKREVLQEIVSMLNKKYNKNIQLQ